MGTPVLALVSMRPLVIDFAVTSCCDISLLISTPTGTITSTVPDRARNCAASGSSKDPGTSDSTTFSKSPPYSPTAVLIPVTSSLPISSRHRDLMMPTRSSLMGSTITSSSSEGSLELSVSGVGLVFSASFVSSAASGAVFSGAVSSVAFASNAVSCITFSSDAVSSIAFFSDAVSSIAFSSDTVFSIAFSSSTVSSVAFSSDTGSFISFSSGTVSLVAFSSDTDSSVFFSSGTVSSITSSFTTFSSFTFSSAFVCSVAFSADSSFSSFSSFDPNIESKKAPKSPLRF
mmetsp:Transcript_92289/g.177130  ORF Transcript_92289/g.177130 Transcript_92289/m.177130 type:complete len:288 (+) Transcript_92289:452-1315(+)